MSEIKNGVLRASAVEIGARIETMMAQGQTAVLEITGDSMRPTLKPGRDAVVLAPLESWPPKKGDILLFHTPRAQGGYSLHRVYSVKPEGPVMNGDAQQWTEGPVAREQVVAQAIALLRKGQPVDVQRRGYRAYVWLWRWTRPIRWPMFALWRGIKKLAG